MLKKKGRVGAITLFFKIFLFKSLLESYKQMSPITINVTTEWCRFDSGLQYVHSIATILINTVTHINKHVHEYKACQNRKFNNISVNANVCTCLYESESNQSANLGGEGAWCERRGGGNGGGGVPERLNVRCVMKGRK
jgi:hypothetical protein